MVRDRTICRMQKRLICRWQLSSMSIPSVRQNILQQRPVSALFGIDHRHLRRVLPRCACTARGRARRSRFAKASFGAKGRQSKDARSEKYGTQAAGRITIRHKSITKSPSAHSNKTDARFLLYEKSAKRKRGVFHAGRKSTTADRRRVRKEHSARTAERSIMRQSFDVGGVKATVCRSCHP